MRRCSGGRRISGRGPHVSDIRFLGGCPAIHQAAVQQAVHSGAKRREANLCWSSSSVTGDHRIHEEHARALESYPEGAHSARGLIDPHPPGASPIDDVSGARRKGGLA